MADAEELKLLIRSRHPIISIETVEEAKALHTVRRAVGAMQLPLFAWTVVDGLQSIGSPTQQSLPKTKSAKAALKHILDINFWAIYIFKDLCDHLQNAETVRLLREVGATFGSDQRCLIMIDHHMRLPDVIKRLAVPFEVALPDAKRLEEVVRKTYRELKTLQDVEARLTQSDMDTLVQNLRGLTEDEAALAVSRAVLQDGLLDSSDLGTLLQVKQEAVAESGLLDYIPTADCLTTVGGLNQLKRWLAKRRGALSAEARDFGLPPPRGVLLLGVQGCGKSLMARVVAAEWGLPLLRLDPSNLYDKFVGESERRLRDAIRLADTMAPIVLWIDEIEKAFASAAAHSTDGGLSQRMFGTLLNWLQDHDSPIFVVATANDITALPPELLRKGRFDEIFFVDLPERSARQEILEVHLQRRKRDPAAFRIEQLLDATAGFSGAEIEQAIVSALYTAFSNHKDLTTEDVLEEIAHTQPLSTTLAERVAALRQWAQGRCVMADG